MHPGTQSDRSILQIKAGTEAGHYTNTTTKAGTEAGHYLNTMTKAGTEARPYQPSG